MATDTILHNAKIATNSTPSFVEALAITDGKIIAKGSEQDILRLRGPATKVIEVPLRSLSERIWYGKACRLPLPGRSRDASIQVK